MLRVVAIIVFGSYGLAILALVTAYFADADQPVPPDEPVAQPEQIEHTDPNEEPEVDGMRLQSD